MRQSLLLFLALLLGFGLGYGVFRLTSVENKTSAPIEQKKITMPVVKIEPDALTPKGKNTTENEKLMVPDIKTNERLTNKNTEKNNIPPDDDRSWLPIRNGTDYFIDENISRFRVYRTKKLNVIDVWDMKEKIGTVDVSPYVFGEGIFQVWSMFTITLPNLDKETRIYFVDATGCGGCVWPSRYYLAINLKTKKVRLETIATEGKLLYQDRFPEQLTQQSKSGKLIAFVPYNWKDKEEKIWIHDLVKNTEQQLFEVPKTQTVLYEDMGHSLKHVSWSINNLDYSSEEILLIEPVTAPEPSSFIWSSESGFSKFRD